MKKILFILLLFYFNSFGQDIKFEKQELNLYRSGNEQVIPVKIVRIDNPNDKDIIVKIESIQGDKIQLNPEVIYYKFLKSGIKEFIFNIKLTDTDTTSKDKKIEILEMIYKDKTGKKQTQRLIINILAYQEGKPKTDEIPDLILFAGTNIDPLGVNKITSSSFNFELKFPVRKCSFVQFGLFTNKNFTADSSSSFYHYYSKDANTEGGMIENKSIVYVQKISPNGKYNTRSNGGYMNVLFECSSFNKTRTYVSLGGEIIFRRTTGTVAPSISLIDSINYKKGTQTFTSKPFNSEMVYSPTRIFTQSFLNFGLKIENTAEKFFITVQPMIGYNFTNSTLILRNRNIDEKQKGVFGEFRTYLNYKPLNIALILDAKFVKNYPFYNFSIGIPLEIKGIFEKK